jgi:nucleoside-diphosphate-sugar epimerase
VTTGKVLMQSDGTPWRPLVHIRDIILAFQCALTAPKDVIHDEAFNVGQTKENYRIREVAELVAQVVPNCELSFAAGASADLRNYRVDFTKIETKLPGFKPAWTLRQGIEELYEAYKRIGLTAEDWAGARYYRLKTIKGLMARNELDEQLRRS